VQFFCSPIGLGHATRDVAVAAFFEGVKTEFVTGGAAAKIISDHGFEVQSPYSPPRFEVRDGRLAKPLRWLWQYYTYYKECKKIAGKMIREESPDLVVSDEDFASLGIAQSIGIPTVLITDILQTRFTSGIGSLVEKRMNKSMQDMIKGCASVILPEIGDDEGNISRVGPIVRPVSATREDLREKFGFARKTITISVGGTDAGRFLIQKAVEATENLENVDTVLVSGPSIQTDSKIRNLGFVSNLHEIIYASDLVISLAGKSTIDEARAYGTPGIFIPILNHFEQEDNARDEGFTYNDIFRLRELVKQRLDLPRLPVTTDGAEKAWRIIKRHL